MKAFHDLEAKKLEPLWGLLWVLRFRNLFKENAGDVLPADRLALAIALSHNHSLARLTCRGDCIAIH